MIRSFTSQLDKAVTRSVDDDAPIGLRQELVDLAFHVFVDIGNGHNEAWLYQVICQSSGVSPSGHPSGGFRHAASRTVDQLDWPRVYDLVSRLWSNLEWGAQTEYRSGVNRILAGYRIAWDLGEDGRLHRVLPRAVASQVESAFRELDAARFSAARAAFIEAMNAYNDRPQRGRDACKSIFDALESVSKEILGMPTATFGNVLVETRKKRSMENETIAHLQKLYDMANNHFRHGMTTPFALTAAEVDYVLLSCIGGILLFLRLP